MESKEETDEFITRIYSKYGEENMKNSGGFTMFCGILRQSKTNPDRIEPFHLLSNRGAPAVNLFETDMIDADQSVVFANGDASRVPEDIKKETIGISNSEVTDPWPKVHLGVEALEQVVAQGHVPEEKLIEQLKDILISDTFPLETARKEVSTDGIFSHVSKSVFIPPINVHLQDNTDLHDGYYYGTRTNTIILVSKTGHVKYIERTLHEKDVPTEEPSTESVFEFDIEGFNR